MPVPLWVIIDPQHDFTHPQGQYAARHAGISQIIAAGQQIRRILLHLPPEQAVIVCSEYQPHQFGTGLSLALPGTFGQQTDSNVVPSGMSADRIIKKEHSAFSSAAFRRFLTHYEGGTLIICGFLAAYCVRHTALDAIAAGYQVILPADAIGTGDDVQHRRIEMLETLVQAGALCIPAAASLQ